MPPTLTNATSGPIATISPSIVCPRSKRFGWIEASNSVAKSSSGSVTVPALYADSETGHSSAAPGAARSAQAGSGPEGTVDDCRDRNRRRLLVAARLYAAIPSSSCRRHSLSRDAPTRVASPFSRTQERTHELDHGHSRDQAGRVARLEIEKKDKTLLEPVQFYRKGSRQLHEVVVFSVQKDRITGYLSTPKAGDAAAATP